jgi:hypothetical protein
MLLAARVPGPRSASSRGGPSLIGRHSILIWVAFWGPELQGAGKNTVLMAIKLKSVTLILMGVIGLWAGRQPLAAAEPEKIALRVIYCGALQSERGKDFVSFLNEHFTKVGQGELGTFDKEEAGRYDVAILDYDEVKVVNNHIEMPPIGFDRSYARPLMTLGATGALVCDRMRLKTGYL